MDFRLSNEQHGKEYWRSLEEFADSAELRELLEREYPSALDWPEPDKPSRRRFLTLMAASLALAGVAGCSRPVPENISPYVRQPESMVPGEPLFFATAMTVAGYAQGLLVKSYMGRPIKVEGNPDHPASPLPIYSPPHAKFGPADLYAQAAPLTFYDPERAQTVTHLGNISTWEAFVTALNTAIARRGGEQQARIHLLTEAVSSPTLAEQIRRFLRRFPNARWHAFEPADQDNAMQGARQAFGDAFHTRYRFDRAHVILSLEADFLSCGPGQMRYVRDFSSRRLAHTPAQRQRMNRLYVVESTPTVTGSKADHRLALRPRHIAEYAAALATQLGLRISGEPARTTGIPAAWLSAVAQDLRASSPHSLVLVGDSQPPFVHAVAHALNAHLGNAGQTVEYTKPVLASAEAEPLRALSDAMAAGVVDVLIIIGSNPVYTAPADLDFASRMNRVPLRVHLSLYNNETSALCHWNIPECHFLESWSDACAYNGTVSLVQPLIAPLYDNRSAHEVLAILSGQPEQSAYDIVRSYWRSLFETTHPWHPDVRQYWEDRGNLDVFRGNFESWWTQALHDGFIAGTALPARSPALSENWAGDARPAASSAEGLDIIFRPDPSVYDGRFANNSWLQEFPKPLTKITWDNAALMSPATAVSLGLAPAEHPEQAGEQLVRLTLGQRSVDAPVFVLPGHPDNAVTVHLGYGRTRAGRVAQGTGFDAYRLRTLAAPWFASGLRVQSLGLKYPLAITQRHHLMHGRDLIRSGDLSEYDELTQRAGGHGRVPLSLFPAFDYDGQQWGMAIDLGLCTGCSSCVIACQAENNVPVVGKTEVLRGREMHWLRIDTYYKGDPNRTASLETYHQPLPCMHCENAPCELVCPVEATAHSSDGLNDMVYNRCVGTRYCSNNCPYKVRRFNFLQYADFTTETIRLSYNPEVTVRTRGVMEKCTYCVQRIRRVEIQARREDRAIADGEVMTACQSACPAGAIVFGNINARTKVAELRSDPLHYGLLEELNTRPRTTYLAAVMNWNPAMPRNG